ncbi:MAG TPA: hypothetical protein VGB94_09790 [Acidobacteriaceae bacterium]
MAHVSELAPLLPFHNDGIQIAGTQHTRAPYAEKREDTLRRSGAPVLSFRAKPMQQEPEDARITGMTRSLYRRLLALNLRKPAAGATAETYATRIA